jgi:DNA-binding transcriptional regulator/RsmH inhibitor MraZ
VWIGESTHTLDAKHRVFLPKRFQDGLGRDAEGNLTAILSRGFEECLFLYSEIGFQRALDRLQTQAFSSEQQRRETCLSSPPTSAKSHNFMVRPMTL